MLWPGCCGLLSRLPVSPDLLGPPPEQSGLQHAFRDHFSFRHRPGLRGPRARHLAGLRPARRHARLHGRADHACEPHHHHRHRRAPARRALHRQHDRPLLRLPGHAAHRCRPVAPARLELVSGQPAQRTEGLHPLRPDLRPLARRWRACACRLQPEHLSSPGHADRRGRARGRPTRARPASCHPASPCGPFPRNRSPAVAPSR